MFAGVAPEDGKWDDQRCGRKSYDNFGEGK
jgi:hypothetical protein